MIVLPRRGPNDIPHDTVQRLTTSYEMYIVTCVSSSLVMIRLCVIIRHEGEDDENKGNCCWRWGLNT